MAERTAPGPVRHLLALPMVVGLGCGSGPAFAQPAWQPVNPNQAPGAPPAPQPPRFVPVVEPVRAAATNKGPIWLPVQDTATTPRTGPEWRAVEPPPPGAERPIAAEAVPGGGKAPSSPSAPAIVQGSKGTTPTAPSQSPPKPPRTQAEAEALLGNLPPTPADYLPLLRLGPAVPTAIQLPEGSWQFSFGQLAPFGGGGAAGGSGNQNYYARFDSGVTDRLQFSAFFSNADDPLFAPIPGRQQPFNESPQPSNYWTDFGGALQWQLVSSKAWSIGLSGSLEQFQVGSGGCDSFNCRFSTGNTYSPNIFNNSGLRVFTRNLVGSISLPITWKANQQLQFTFTPGAAFLPATQGAGSGGAGTFYGSSLTVAAGASWRVLPKVTLFGSGLLPLGPGTNSFDSSLTFSRVPIVTAGLNFALNPRIGLEGALTNGWGATPATAFLALPSDNRLGFNTRFIFNPGAPDSPSVPMSRRQRSLALGGLTVNTAMVPAAGTVEAWANADSQGNIFGFLGYSASNDFQFQYSGGVFNNVPQTNSLSTTYTTDGGFNERIGGKAIVLSQLRGAPLSAGGRITLGRNRDPDSFQGFVFFETINTWEATPWLALNINPKVAWSGVATPFGVGLSANLQLGSSFQLIPEVNLVADRAGSSSNGTLALRWLTSQVSAIDLYVSNAAGLLDLGQLLGNRQIRVGGRFLLSF